jgi:hypothetical protein
VSKDYQAKFGRGGEGGGERNPHCNASSYVPNMGLNRASAVKIQRLNAPVTARHDV